MIAAVATTFLASCSNNAVLNDVQDDKTPTVIGFSTYSQKATRAATQTDLEYYHNTFAVYGTKQSDNDATDIQYVFGGKATAAGAQNGVTCTFQTTADALLGEWKYTDPRYWDKQASYNFIAYAPVSDNNPIRYYYSAEKAQVGDDDCEFKTTATYTLTGTNLQATATEEEKVKGFTTKNEDEGDLDLMISGKNSQAGATHENYVNLSFRHILSKLNVTFSKAESLQGVPVTIKEVKITGLYDSGDFIESNYNADANPKVSGWTSSAVDEDYTLLYSTDGQALNNGTYQDTDDNPETPDVFVKGNPFFFIESLVMPQNIADAGQVFLIAKYTITSGGYDEDYTYKLDLYDVANLRKFYDGYNYTLNFTINPDVIKFDATVVTWADQTAINKTIGVE